MTEQPPLYLSLVVVAGEEPDSPHSGPLDIAAAIEETIESFVAQGWPEGFSEIVVCGAPQGFSHDRVTVVPVEKSGPGVNPARVAGARMCCGDALVFVDAGLTLAPGSLASAVAVFDRSESIAAVGFDLVDSGGERVGRDDLLFNPSTGEFDPPPVSGATTVDGDLRGIRTVLCVDTSAAILSPRAYQRCGGHPVDLTGPAADVDLGWQFTSMGFRCLATDSAQVVIPASRLRTPREVGRSATSRIVAANADDDILEAVGSEEVSESVAQLRRRRRRVRRRADFESLHLFSPELGMAVGSRRRIVIATADNLAAQMAGPAIRTWKIAEALAADHDVRILANKASIDSDDFEIRIGNDRSYRDAIEWCDVFIFQGWILADRPYIAQSDKVLVADIYDPMHLEQLEQAADGGALFRRVAVEDTVGTLNEQLLRADFAICASDQQRSFWLGQLAALGRVNPETYDDDPTLRSLIDVAPFGIAETAPEPTRHGIREEFDGIGPDDPVILWGGGVYNWFDPLTLIRAVNDLTGEFPDIRLVFMGMAHPNPDVPTMRMAVETEALAEELGLAGTHVFFNRHWVDFDERHNFLCDADVGVATHFPGIETDYSFRTRILDYLWAGLPTVTTEGGALSDLVERHHAGITVPPRDVDALANALRSVLSDALQRGEMAANARDLGETFRWSIGLKTLVEFCRSPRRAPDLLNPVITDSLQRSLAPPPLARSRPLRRAMVALKLLDEGGPTLLAERVRLIVRQRLPR